MVQKRSKIKSEVERMSVLFIISEVCGSVSELYTGIYGN
jgi:hypothetical protein